MDGILQNVANCTCLEVLLKQCAAGTRDWRTFVQNDGPQIKRVEGQGNGYQNLDLTESTIAEILANGKVDQPVYKSVRGPIDLS
jgi:hypothetical protein